MTDDLLNDIPRGNPNKAGGDVPQEYFADPEEVIEHCPFDGSTLIAGAFEDELAGEMTELGSLQLAGSGSGKTVQLISTAIHYRGSMLIVDPKGSVAKAVARWRAEGRHLK
mgnify:CR=1 FL=1